MHPIPCGYLDDPRSWPEPENVNWNRAYDEIMDHADLYADEIAGFIPDPEDTLATLIRILYSPDDDKMEQIQKLIGHEVDSYARREADKAIDIQ